MWWAFCRMMTPTLAVLYTQAMLSIQYAIGETRNE